MKKKIFTILGISLFAIVIISAICSISFYFMSLKPVDKDAKENVTFTVKAGEATNTILKNLKNVDLIKSDFMMKIYAKMNPGTPQAGTYIFSKAMDAKEIYDSILSGKVTRDTIWVTFVEGKRLTYIADVIAKNFGFTKDEIMATLDDTEYVKSLIDKYDCLTESILNNKIYHPLEGYLFTDTYEFDSNVSIKGIIERMIDETESKLSAYNDTIEASKLSKHEIMTLASIVELEGARSNDRKGVAGVFYNRLKSGWTLGSDVTTYYAVGKDFNVDLSYDDLKTCNGYNTRGTCVQGLPVGPIASPSFESIKAVLTPSDHDYYFFVADKSGNTYFSKTNAEHDATIARLQREGKWYNY